MAMCSGCGGFARQNPSTARSAFADFGCISPNARGYKTASAVSPCAKIPCSFGNSRFVMSPLHTYRVCGRPQIRSGHVTGNCDPDHILAEIKERGVFEFTVTMTAVQNCSLH